jgi:hypothetical protein
LELGCTVIYRRVGTRTLLRDGMGWVGLGPGGSYGILHDRLMIIYYLFILYSTLNAMAAMHKLPPALSPFLSDPIRALLASSPFSFSTAGGGAGRYFAQETPTPETKLYNNSRKDAEHTNFPNQPPSIRVIYHDVARGQNHRVSKYFKFPGEDNTRCRSETSCA